jgi:hypothetical protein
VDHFQVLNFLLNYLEQDLQEVYFQHLQKHYFGHHLHHQILLLYQLLKLKVNHHLFLHQLMLLLKKLNLNQHYLKQGLVLYYHYHHLQL